MHWIWDIPELVVKMTQREDVVERPANAQALEIVSYKDTRR